MVVFQANDGRECKKSAFGGLVLQDVCKLQNLFGRCGGRNNDLHREVTTTGKGGGHHGKEPKAWNGVELGLHFWKDFEGGALSLAPWHQSHARHTALRIGQLKRKSCLRLTLENLSDLFREEGHLVDAGIGRGLQNAKNNPLILCGSQFFGGLGIKKDSQEKKSDPYHVDGGTSREGAIQHPSVKVLHFCKGRIDAGRKPTVLDSGIEQLGGHHGR